MRPARRVPWMLHIFKKRVARTPVKSTGQALGRVNDMNKRLDNFLSGAQYLTGDL